MNEVTTVKKKKKRDQPEESAKPGYNILYKEQDNNNTVHMIDHI